MSCNYNLFRLDSFINVVERQLDCVKQDLEPYEGIEEVDHFIQSREETLKKFKDVARGYRCDMPIYQLREALKLQKKYNYVNGLMCKGEEFFEPTKKVEEAIDLENYAMACASSRKEEVINGCDNPDYCIYDERDYNFDEGA